MLLNHWIKNTCFFAFIIWLAGCSGGYPVKVYDGEDRPDVEVAVLQVPEDIDVVTIDGKEMKSYLLENLAINYQLLPGEREVVFKYSGLFATPKRDEDGKGVETVVSENQVMRFTAEAGKTYTFDYLSPESRSEAHKVAKSFSASLVSGANTIAQSALFTKEGEPGIQAAVIDSPAPVTDNRAPSIDNRAPNIDSKGAKIKLEQDKKPVVVEAETIEGESSSPEVIERGRLESLKSLWSSATEEEKKEFLRWAFK